MRELLRATRWENAIITPIAGDASARQYARLDHPSAILMSDPSGDTKRFAQIATILRHANLCPPDIFAHDPDRGMMIISDLGRMDFAHHLAANPDDSPSLYQTATDVLVTLYQQKIDADLPRMTHDVAADMIGLAAQHYAPNMQGEIALHDALRCAFDAHVDPALHLSLRDFHAENLIWRPEKTGTDRAGLLDFQDACMAPMGYDVMSLVRDARRDIDTDTSEMAINRFLKLTGLSGSDASAHLACVGAQRNLRILGIFARLATLNGKQNYLNFLPRVWAYLMTDLGHPALSDLRDCVTTHLPTPDATTLSRLRQK